MAPWTSAGASTAEHREAPNRAGGAAPGAVQSGRSDAGDGGSGPIPLERLATAGRSRRRTRLPAAARRLVGPAVLFAIWALVTNARLVDSRDLAPPRAVWDQAWRLVANGRLPHALSVSLGRALLGLGFGVVISLALAIVATSARLADDLIDSSMNVLRAVPIIALLPLIIIWVGIGESARVFIVAIGATFPLYINLHGAIRGVDLKLVEAARVFGVSRVGLVRKVIIPGALPGFLVGLRWAIGVAWLLLVFAEQINTTSGLGYLLNVAQGLSQSDVIMLLLIVYGAIGLLGDGLVRVLEHRLLAWRRGFVAR